MADPPKVKVTVHEITKGECPADMKVGDSWIIENKTPGEMCASAYNVLYPTIRAIRLQGWTTMRGGPDNEVAYLSCPDRNRWVIFEVRRLSD